jgi:hypothetical protein
VVTTILQELLVVRLVSNLELVLADGIDALEVAMGLSFLDEP